MGVGSMSGKFRGGPDDVKAFRVTLPMEVITDGERKMVQTGWWIAVPEQTAKCLIYSDKKFRAIFDPVDDNARAELEKVVSKRRKPKE